MRERIYIKVADYCLIEAIRKFDDSGCDGIELGKVDNNWLVSYYKEPVECYQDTISHSNQDNEFEHVPVGGTIPTELYNIIKDKIKYGIEYHECDGTKINKKEYKFLYNFIGHKYDDVGDNADASDFRLPNAKGWYIRIK